jgi:hypothetical protein
MTVSARLVAGLREALGPPSPPPPPPPPPPPKPEDTPSRFQRIVQLVGSIIAPVSLITALMFYVGWVRSDALFQRFGIDAALLQFSNQDYLLRSVDSLWLPVGLLLLTGLGPTWAYRSVRTRVERGTRPPHIRRVAQVLIAAGVVLTLLGLFEVILPGWLPIDTLIFPVVLGAGVATVYCGTWLLRCATAMEGPKPVTVPSHSALPATLAALLIVLNLFWAAGEYAKAIGRGIADRIAADPSSRPSVIIYSEKRLYLGGGLTVAEEVLPDDPTARFRYRYSKLRLLTAFGDRLFLIPDSWAEGRRDAILLVLDSSVRIETGPGEL